MSEKIRIDIVEIVIALMIFIITVNVINIRRDYRIINKDILLENKNYYETEGGEILNK